MWIVDVVCSDPTCAEKRQVIVADFDELDTVLCGCGCCVVTLAISARALERTAA